MVVKKGMQWWRVHDRAGKHGIPELFLSWWGSWGSLSISSCLALWRQLLRAVILMCSQCPVHGPSMLPQGEKTLDKSHAWQKLGLPGQGEGRWHWVEHQECLFILGPWPQRHCDKWRKSGQKRQMLYDLSYMWNLKKQRTPINKLAGKEIRICGYQRWGRCGGGQEELDEVWLKRNKLLSCLIINIRDIIYNILSYNKHQNNIAIGI